MNNSRILILSRSLNLKDGWSRYASDLIRFLKKSGQDVDVFSELGNKTNILKTVFKIRSLLKRYDIIHALDGHPNSIIAACANIGLNKKLVITVIGTYSVDPLYRLWSGLFLRWAYKRADKIISISNFTKDQILKKVKINNIEVINPGIDYQKFYRPHLETKEKFVLSVGALKYRKGYHISIPAFAKAKKEIPNLKYKIVGDQSNKNYFQLLKSLTKEYGVEKDVDFIENIPDEELSKLYQTASLFILTSVNENNNFEGFGLVFLEAAATSLPVIGTTGNGIEDAIENSKNGFLVPQNNIEETTRAIVKILQNSNVYEEFSKNSFLWAANHKIEPTINKYLDIYNQ